MGVLRIMSQMTQQLRTIQQSAMTVVLIGHLKATLRYLNHF